MTPPIIDVSPKLYSQILTDVDALADGVRKARFEHVQIERGAFQAVLNRIDIGDLKIDSGCYTRKVIARGDFPPGTILLGCLLDSNEQGYINGYRFNRNDIVIFPLGAELDYIQPSATRWCAIPLSEALLEQAGCQEMQFDRIKVMPGHWPLIRLLRGLLHNPSDSKASVASTAQPPQPCKAILLDKIREVLQRYLSDPGVRRPSLQRRMALLRQYERHICEHITEVLRLPELCSELGVSQRVLEYVVKEDLGITPKQYDGLIRLHAFRRELLRNRSGNKTIAEIAGRYGINHLGRLSAAYQRQFGELPSETLRR